MAIFAISIKKNCQMYRKHKKKNKAKFTVNTVKKAEQILNQLSEKLILNQNIKLC